MEPVSEGETGVASPFARGATVHRYVILERVGQGGMGVVYAAYDPRLDRRVALKFLHSHGVDVDGVREKRLLREAQAMARLSHPNVAVVYEVRSFQNHVFLAMEFVDGMDLRRWLGEKERPFAEIMDIFRSVGRGLAAAHAAGIVHRDFKPENVLLDAHDRPRVTDFGLSRAIQGPADEDVGDEAIATALPSPGRLSQLTREGGVIGTPSYMSPEQHLGSAVDARTDQFAFCVALHEALYLEHPFRDGAGQPIDDPAAARPGGPAQSSVPRWCRQAILRGLSRAPEDRFPSMDALLAALTPSPMSRRTQIAIAGSLGVVLACVAAYALFFGRSDANAGPRCDLGAGRLAGVWDAARKGQVRDAFQRSAARGADLTWNEFSAIVDRRAAAWVAMHNQACAATHVDGVQSPAVLDLRMECLDRKRQEMKGLVDLYAERPDAGAVDRAVAAADKLSPISGCAEIANLRAVVPLPEDPAVRAKVRSLRERVSHSRALFEAGRFEQGAEYMVSLKREADAVGYAPLAAEAANALGLHLNRVGKTEEADKALFEAAKRSIEGRDWNQEAEAWLTLLANYGDAGRLQESLLVARMAELAVERAGAGDEVRARLANATGAAEFDSDHLVDALRHYRRAEELWRKSLGPRSPRVGIALSNIGGALIALGRTREGLDHLERALALQRQIMRPDHPNIAHTLSALGRAYMDVGQYRKGLEVSEGAVEIRVEELGAEHPLTTDAQSLVAVLDALLGNFDRSLALHAKVISIQKRTLGPRDPYVASAIVAMGEAQRQAGLLDEAERTLRQAIEHVAAAGSPDNLNTGFALTALGRVHGSRRQYELAMRDCRRALEILVRTLGQDSTYLLETRECIAEALIEAGDFAAARKQLELALGSTAAQEAGPQWTAGSRFQLARALWPTPDERPRALELARTTLDALSAAEGTHGALTRRIETWLAAHGSPRSRD
jgi:eukaryotic-like serine/threonine-protein kinase